jgi:hypothetical protein
MASDLLNSHLGSGWGQPDEARRGAIHDKADTITPY